jgi:hypothetical protein
MKMDETKFESLTELIPIWKPQVGEDITATFRGWKPSKFKQLAVFEAENGKKFTVGGAVIDRALKEVPEGTLIYLKFLGEKKAKSGQTFHDFEVGKAKK